MVDDSKTQPKRPLPKRPQWGWVAWEATVGYIYEEYSPDVMLSLSAYPKHGITLWDSRLTWGQNAGWVEGRIGLEIALQDLWLTISQHHRIFKTVEAQERRPEGYDDTNWFDSLTLETISRLVGVTATVFEGDWSLIVTYRPIETPLQRVQARLVAHQNQVVRGGMGATLRDACRSLFHNTTPDYKQYMKNPLQF